MVVQKHIQKRFENGWPPLLMSIDVRVSGLCICISHGAEPWPVDNEHPKTHIFFLGWVKRQKNQLDPDRVCNSSQ